MRQSKAEKAIDQRIERSYYRTSSGVQIDIMDISKVFRAGREAILGGADESALDAAITAFVATIRRN